MQLGIRTKRRYHLGERRDPRNDLRRRLLENGDHLPLAPPGRRHPRRPHDRLPHHLSGRSPAKARQNTERRDGDHVFRSIEFRRRVDAVCGGDEYHCSRAREAERCTRYSSCLGESFVLHCSSSARADAAVVLQGPVPWFVLPSALVMIPAFLSVVRRSHLTLSSFSLRSTLCALN